MSDTKWSNSTLKEYRVEPSVATEDREVLPLARMATWLNRSPSMMMSQSAYSSAAALAMKLS